MLAHAVAVVTPGGRALAAGSGRHGVLGASGNMNRFLFTVRVGEGWGLEASGCLIKVKVRQRGCWRYDGCLPALQPRRVVRR